MSNAGISLWTTRRSLLGRRADQTDTLVESEVRRRRPIIRETPVVDEVEPVVETETTQDQPGDGRLAQISGRRRLNSAWKSFTVRWLKPCSIGAVTNGGARRATLVY